MNKTPPKSDAQCVDLIRNIMDNNPGITRKELYAMAHISQKRCDQLASIGLVKLPRAVKPSERGRRGRLAAGNKCELKIKDFLKSSEKFTA